TLLGITSTVGVALGQPERSVGSRCDRPQPAVLALEEGRRVTGERRAVERDPPQPFTPQRRHPQRPLRVGEAGRGGLVGAPDRQRFGERRVGVLAPSLDIRPAIVGAWPDQIDLVPLVLAELRCPQTLLRVEREALRIAVTEAPDRRVLERI